MKAILITGINGGIGCAVANAFCEKGYAVLGIDLQSSASIDLEHYWQIDLAQFVLSLQSQAEFSKHLENVIEDDNLELVGIINNAAVQILGSVSTLKMDDFLVSQAVNVAAPLLLSQISLPFLQASNGMVINMGSIHAEQTKPEFVSYSTSKAAIRGLTQSMAVDLAGSVRVVAIEPAAIATDMLIDGFKAQPEKLNELHQCHPSGKIGLPSEVAELCYFLVNSSLPFLNGTCIGLNGGIASRLHDPV